MDRFRISRGDTDTNRGRQPIIRPNFHENCMKINKIERGGHASQFLLRRSATES